MIYRVYYRWKPPMNPDIWHFADFSTERSRIGFLRNNGLVLEEAAELDSESPLDHEGYDWKPPERGSKGCIYLGQNYLRAMPAQLPHSRGVEDGRLIAR